MAVRKKRNINIRRAYEEPASRDGYRVLVDRHWPRGRSREALKLGEWARDIAPEPALIHWYGHVPERWPAFRTRYLAWLAGPERQDRLRALLKAAGRRRITLVYGARTETANQAVVLREVLEQLDS
jgi:uncharacterized protein YeaO (DUF488 family)